MTIRISIKTMDSVIPPNRAGLSIKRTHSGDLLVTGEPDSYRTVQFIMDELEAMNVDDENRQVRTSCDLGLEYKITVLYNPAQTTETDVMNIVEKAVADSCIHQPRLDNYH